jgi:hypothetical protein
VAAPATRPGHGTGHRRRAALGAGIFALFVTLAVPGTALASSQPDGSGNFLQPAASGDQVQGGDALPGDTQITVPQTPFVTDGSSAPFDRAAAVSFALAHAQDPEPFPAGCTYFVTRALFAAGIPENPQWNLDGSHGEIWYLTERPGTPAATAVTPFIQAIMSAYPASQFIPLTMSQNNVPQAQLGDLIAYDWNGDGTYDHLAIITGFAAGDPQYPLVSEWGVYGWPDMHTRYSSRGWTWSQKDGTWLQSERGNADMTAALIHIDTTIPSTY